MKNQTKFRGKKFSRESGVFLRLFDENGHFLKRFQKREKLLSSCAAFSAEQWAKGIKVAVSYQPDVENSGTFYNRTQISNALRDWLSPDLVEYCTDDNW